MACIFVSGIAGLVYEIAWARYLALFLGHTSYAVVAVLVAFMGGLALGYAWIGKWADRTSAPLAMYAGLEIGIGILGLLFPWYYEFCREAFVTLALAWQPRGAALFALKFAFSSLAILLPTVLMGGTLPVLARFVTQSLADLRPRVAALYCLNSAGAVAGCLLADFLLIPLVGLQLTVWDAAAMNLIVGLIALALHRRLQGIEPAPAPVEEVEEQFTPGELKLAMIAIGASGFVAMLYEVAWTRLLALALGSSTHAFSIMLTTFIAGIATGSWLIYRWKRLRSTLDAFGWAELALAATLFGSMFFYDLIPYWFARLSNLLARTEEAYPLYELCQALICFGVMFVPAVCLGMTLPLASRVATQEVARTGRSVGGTFAVNTLGTVLGTAVTGFALLPWLGLARTFAFGVAANAVIGLALLARCRLLQRPAWAAPAPVMAVAVVWLAGGWFESWPRALTLGLWRNQNPPQSVAEFRALAARDEIRYYRDGAGETVCVEAMRCPQGQKLTLKVNGKADASTGADMTTQLLAGHLPMLLRPHSHDVLVVGLGSGVTCGAVTTHPNLRRVDVVEISPEVAQAARCFAPYNNHVLDNPTLRLVIEDAKSFLKTSLGKYDIIISEPSNPWMAGVAGVFSREFYQTCRSSLRADGLMVQWVQVYETSDEAFDVVLATFLSVFPHTSIWQTSVGDLVLIGSPSPTRVNLDALATRITHPSVAADLARIQLTSVPLLLSLQVVSEDNAPFIPSPDAVVHNDFHPVLEYIAQRGFFARRKAEQWKLFDETACARPETLLGMYLARNPLTVADYRAFSRFHLTYQLPSVERFRSLLARWHQADPKSSEPVELAALIPDPASGPMLQAQLFASVRDSIFQLAVHNPVLLGEYRKSLLAIYRAQCSAFFVPPSAELQAVLEQLVVTDPAHRYNHQLQLAKLAWDRNERDVCLRRVEQALASRPPNADGVESEATISPLVLGQIAEACWEMGHQKHAIELCQMPIVPPNGARVLAAAERKLQSRHAQLSGFAHANGGMSTR
jgi:predicted membrane-bound spermidine synthase